MDTTTRQRLEWELAFFKSEQASFQALRKECPGDRGFELSAALMEGCIHETRQQLDADTIVIDDEIICFPAMAEQEQVDPTTALFDARLCNGSDIHVKGQPATHCGRRCIVRLCENPSAKNYNKHIYLCPLSQDEGGHGFNGAVREIQPKKYPEKRFETDVPMVVAPAVDHVASHAVLSSLQTLERQMTIVLLQLQELRNAGPVNLEQVGSKRAAGGPEY